MQRFLLYFVGLLVAASLIACRQDSSSAAAGQAVARVGDSAISETAFRARIEEQPAPIRQRYAALDGKKDLLENMIRFELLLQEARRQKLDQDPEVRATVEKIIVQRLIQRETEKAAGGQADDAALRKYYEQHLSEFVRPARVRLSHLFVASAASDPRRAQLQAEAERLLAEVRKKEASNPSAFAELARTRSDDPATRTLGGDLGLKTQPELEAVWGKQFADGAFALTTVSKLALIPTERGFHLVKLTALQPASEVSFEAARPRIESRLAVEKRARSVDDLVASLRTKTRVEIDEGALSRIEVAAPGGTSAASNQEQ